MTSRAVLIQKSLGCFDAGLASAIPLIGLIGAAVALLRFRHVVVETNDRWNPARARLYMGAGLALLSLLLHGIAAFVIFLKVRASLHA